MDGRRAADAIKSRRIKTDKGDAWALAEMLRTGWFSSVYVKSVDAHRLKALLGARDQLVKLKALSGQSGAWPPSPVRHQTAVAGWREEIRVAANERARRSRITALAYMAAIAGAGGAIYTEQKYFVCQSADKTAPRLSDPRGPLR